jgi:ferrous iron transport protein A
MPIKNLSALRAGESGKITRIEGGHGMVNRLAALGIRPGQQIRKLNSSFIRGPVTVEVNRTQIAIGFGMANRIIVEVDDNTR